MSSAKQQLPTMRLADVAKHASRESAWLVVDGTVCDVTPFLYEHPGGADELLPYLGRDATRVFHDAASHAHSRRASALVAETYAIGRLHPDDCAPTTTSAAAAGVPGAIAAAAGKSDKARQDAEDERVRGLVDMKKAVVPQVLRMSAADYQAWVHLKTAPTMRIFQWSFFEAFSHYPWWYIFFLWVPVISAAMWYSVHLGYPPALAAVTYALGVCAWGFIEYLLHRFLFHMPTYGPITNFLHLLIHGIHHVTPMDSTRLAFPPVFAVVVGLGFYSAAISILPAGFAQALFAGGATGYMFYDALHFYFHHGDVWWFPAYVRKLKSRHLDHHYKNDGTNFGVTSPVFDILFGTFSA